MAWFYRFVFGFTKASHWSIASSDVLRLISSDDAKPAASQVVRRLVDRLPTSTGTLYLGFPVFGSPDGAKQIDALLVSPDLGFATFDLHEQRALGDYVDRQDDLANKLDSRLREHRPLMRGRNLGLSIRTATVAPAARQLAQVDPEHPVFKDVDSVASWLAETAEALDSTLFEALVSAVQNLGGLRAQQIPRIVSNLASKAAKLRALEDRIATMDESQDKAVLETFDGVQRIRGLAGSGKTVVLARKAALLHSRHPDWNIAVTFETWSLKPQFEKLIRQFLANQRLGEPDWDRLHVFSCWGSPHEPGLYSTYCRVNNIPYYDVTNAKRHFGSTTNLLGSVSKEALRSSPQPRPYYDAVLVDEAQDLSRDFLRLCYELLRPPRRLVYAYDELQSLDDSSMSSPEEVFGKHPDGTPRVHLGRNQDFILERCYRNSGPVLTLAHALGFGIYRKRLVQIFDDKDLWKDIGYVALNDGGIVDGEECILSRTDQTSPRFLEMDESPSALIETHVFKDSAEQDKWLVRAIKSNRQADELRPNDILVINPDPFTTRRNVGAVRALLFAQRIPTILAGIDRPRDVFFDNESIVFSGIRRARGNEASMVYIINAQECAEANPYDLARVRNRLFTGITRSKAWVRISGYGSAMEKLAQEIRKVEAENYRLRFVYPDEPTRARMRRVNKDRTNKKRKLLNEIQKAILDGELDIDDIESLHR